MKFGVDMEAKLTYDANGNILTMNQNGLKINTSPLIDQLSYTYQTNSNKLSKVLDAVVDKDSKLGDFIPIAIGRPATKGSTDYSYDANGNLISDANKKITSIAYNFLNLPSVITITGNGSAGSSSGTITYTYDAAGNKLKKITQENAATVPFNGTNYTSNITTTTTYIGSSVYESKAYSNSSLASLQYTDVLQFMAHEEGRIRLERDGSGNITSFTYDYFLKDHLGNVRMVLTEEQKTDLYPPASMEAAQGTTEERFYANLPSTRTAISAISGYPTDTYTNPNEKVARTNGSGNKIGPSIILKVMAGDQFNIRVSSWYKKNGANPGSPNSIATDLVTNLINSLTGAGGPVHGSITSTQLTNSGVIPVSTTSFLNSQPPPGSTKPKAYINWILLDEQFKFVQSSSGADQVGNDLEFKVHTKTNLPITKNGYLYVFVSNETPNIDVFWDNLQVTHTRGAILEETHYYPFGLTMAGISSKALNGAPENKYKYNKGSELQNKEFSDGSGLEWYATNLRSLDPQLGRWWQIDSKPDYAQSLYSAMNNNPILYNDPLGDTTINGQKYEFTNPNHPQVLSEIKITAKSNKESNNLSGTGLGALGFAAAYGDAKMFNNKSWFNLKAGRSYSQKYFGNQYQSAEEINTAKGLSKNVSRSLKVFGFGIGLWSQYNILNDKKMSGTQKSIETGSNVISTFGGVYGAAWGIGWEAGRTITQIPSYRQNVRPLIQDFLGVPRDEVPKISSEDEKYFQ